VADTLQVEEIQASQTVSGSADGATVLLSRTAKHLEFIVDVTAINGTPDLIVVFEASLDDSGTIFGEIGRTASLTAVSQTLAAFSRFNDNALGRRVRISWIFASATDITFRVLMGRTE